MAFRGTLSRAAKVLLPGLREEVEYQVSKQPERLLRRAGIQKISLVCLPTILQKALQASLQEYSYKRLGIEVSQLSAVLKARSSGWNNEAIESVRELRSDLRKAVDVVMVDNHESEDDVESEAKLAASGQKVQYTEKATAAYMAARMPCTYAACVRVLQEIKVRLDDFSPKSLLDFGSGPGTSIWASNCVWPGQIQRMTVVEPSSSMLHFCRLLLQGIPGLPSVQSFPSLDSLSRKLRGDDRIYDLVIASYALGEVSDPEKEAVVRRLWSHTRDVLVLVEPGTPRGWQTVLAARQQVLATEKKRQRKVPSDEEEQQLKVGAHIVAPCAHDGRCPMDGTKSWCHFIQRVQRSELHRLVKKAAGGAIRFNHEDELFSFVVLRRGHRPIPTRNPLVLDDLPELQEETTDTKSILNKMFDRQGRHMKYLHLALGKKNDLSVIEEELRRDKEKMNLESDGGDDVEEESEAELKVAKISPSWSRIVREPRRRGAHVILDICTSSDEGGTSGELQRHIVTKGSPKLEYKYARKLKWGDLWPVKFDEDVEEIPERLRGKTGRYI